MSNIRSGVESIRRQVGEAAERSGRRPESVTIIAVSKTRSIEEIREVLAAGITHLGENRVQELKEKWASVPEGVTWHLIGSLQTNKTKPALEMADLIHSVDRQSLADELLSTANRLEKPCSVLVQVNVSGEASKHGVDPAGLETLVRRIGASGSVRVKGLMTMAPLDADPEQARPHFRRLRELAVALEQLALPGVSMEHLSMGMSGDFAAAVEEGATLVRVGTAIFGLRG